MTTDIYKKYKVKTYQEIPGGNPLSFILRKAELGKNLTTPEWEWMERHQLTDAINIIKNQESNEYSLDIDKDQETYRISLLKELRGELFHLRKNSFITSIFSVPDVDSKFSLVLYKVNAQERLDDSEKGFVGKGYNRLINFNDRKQKYKITEDIPLDNSAIKILLQLENKAQAGAIDIKWMSIHNAYSFLNPLKNQFSILQDKYKAIIQDRASIDPLLHFYILQKLEENSLLNQSENQYLKDNGFTETFEISQQIEFYALKVKYKATKVQDNSNAHHLYKVLKRLEALLKIKWVSNLHLF